MRWRETARSRSMSPAAFSLPPADLDQAPHQGADHLVAEGAGRDLEAEQPGLPGAAVGVAGLGPFVDVPAGGRHPADQGPAGVAPHRAPAEGAEVVGAQEDVRGGPHGAEVEAGRGRARPPAPAAGPAPGRSRPGSGSCGRWPGGGRRSPARRPRPGAPPPRGASCRLRARASQTPSEEAAAGRSTWTTCPRACTPASVRPAQVMTGASGMRAVRPSAWLQRAGDRRNLGLGGEAPEGRTVVGDQEPPALRSSAGGFLHLHP